MPRKVGYRSPHAKEWKPGFLLALQEVPNVLRAARLVEIPRSLAYRERSLDVEFSAAWDLALEEGQHVMVEAIESKVYDLIMNNSSFRHNVLRIFFLKSHRPEVYGDRSELKLKGSQEEPLYIAHSIDLTRLSNQEFDQLDQLVHKVNIQIENADDN